MGNELNVGCKDNYLGRSRFIALKLGKLSIGELSIINWRIINYQGTN
jgi:hypothetical protein